MILDRERAIAGNLSPRHQSRFAAFSDVFGDDATFGGPCGACIPDEQSRGAFRAGSRRRGSPSHARADAPIGSRPTAPPPSCTVRASQPSRHGSRPRVRRHRRRLRPRVVVVRPREKHVVSRGVRARAGGRVARPRRAPRDVRDARRRSARDRRVRFGRAGARTRVARDARRGRRARHRRGVRGSGGRDDGKDDARRARARVRRRARRDRPRGTRRRLRRDRHHQPGRHRVDSHLDRCVRRERPSASTIPGVQIQVLEVAQLRRVQLRITNRSLHSLFGRFLVSTPFVLPRAPRPAAR